MDAKALSLPEAEAGEHAASLGSAETGVLAVQEDRQENAPVNAQITEAAPGIIPQQNTALHCQSLQLRYAMKIGPVEIGASV